MIKYDELGRYLIQRGHFKKDVNVDENTGLDSIISLDYMGAAEYEFGSLPQSLKRIVHNDRTCCLKNVIKILDEEFVLYLDKNSSLNIMDIVKVLESLAKGEPKYSVKMGCHLRNYFLGETTVQIKKGCKRKTEIVNNYGFCNFWWDITYDWILIPNHDMYVNKMDIALYKLQKRKFDKK
jgi:hypothetical protein